MERFNNKEIEELSVIKEKIVKKCENKNCVDFGFDEKNCLCYKLFIYIKELFYSKIPKEYWTLTLNNLEVENIYKSYTKKYIKYIDNAIENGQGLIFSGVKRGIGKTTLMSMIGKKAIIKGYDVFYTIAQNVIDDRFSEEHDILGRVEKCDLLLLDELDKIMMRSESNIPKQLENLLRSTLPNKKAILIGTNFVEEEIKEKFEITSLIKRYLKVISM